MRPGNIKIVFKDVTNCVIKIVCFILSSYPNEFGITMWRLSLHFTFTNEKLLPT